MGRTHFVGCIQSTGLSGGPQALAEVLCGVRKSRHQLFHSMTTTTFFHLILPTGSIVGNKRSKDESEKMSLWWVLEGEAVFMASAFYDLNLFLIGNWSSSYISDGQNDTKTFVTLYHKIVPQKNLRAQNSEYLPLLLVLCLSLSFNCSFDS